MTITKRKGVLRFLLQLPSPPFLDLKFVKLHITMIKMKRRVSIQTLQQMNFKQGAEKRPVFLHNNLGVFLSIRDQNVPIFDIQSLPHQ